MLKNLKLKMWGRLGLLAAVFLLIGVIAAPARAADVAFKFMTQSESGDYIGQGQNWNFSTSTGATAIINYNYTNANKVYFNISDSRTLWMGFNFGAKDGQNLSAGLYSPALRLPFKGSNSGIDVGGDGRGCNTILGAFYVHEYSLNTDGTLNKAAIDFVQVCEPDTSDLNTVTRPKLYGSVRYNSDVPVSCDNQGCTAVKNYVLPSSCGNGTIDSGEVCDGTNLNGASCMSNGFRGGSIKCSSDCKSFNYTDCYVDTCDFVKNPNVTDVYIFYNGQYRKFASSSAYNSYNFGFRNVRTLPAGSISPIGADITGLEDSIKTACGGNASTTVATCNDTDTSDNIFNRGYVYGKDENGNSFAKYDECTASAQQVNKYWCYDLAGVGKVSGNKVANCPNGCKDGACIAIVTPPTVTDHAPTCSDDLSKLSYLSGWSTGDSLDKLIRNKDTVGIKRLVNQVLTNRAKINGLTGLNLTNTKYAPSTNERMLADCKWLGHWAYKGDESDVFYIYSYKANKKVSVETDVPFDKISEAENRMVKAITDGYCCAAGSFSTTVVNPNDKTVITNERPNITIEYNSAPAKIITTVNEDTDTKTIILQLNRKIAELENKVVEMEKNLTQKINTVLTSKLKGQILIQPEANGEVWYTSPTTGERFYIKDGQAAYEILSGMGQGIKATDLAKVPLGYDERINQGLKDTDGDGLSDVLENAIGSDPTKTDTDGDTYSDLSEYQSGFNLSGDGRYPVNNTFASKLKGIYLDVDHAGAAWYIKDGLRYYISPDNAYNVMKYLSLGVSNTNLRTIPVGEVTGAQ